MSLPGLTFPNVPNLPGVPQLARAALPSETSVVTFAGGLALSSLFGLVSTQNQWGIFANDGAAIFVADSILEFEHHPRWNISDFPIQGTGSAPTAYASYNKVKLPFECRVRMSKGGKVSDRATFLKALDDAADSVSLYYILTPEYRYNNVDIEYYDVVRSSQGAQADGAYFLTEVDVYFKSINSVQAQYSTTNLLPNAANPSALPPANAGAVTASQPAPSLITELDDGSVAGASGGF